MPAGLLGSIGGGSPLSALRPPCATCSSCCPPSPALGAGECDEWQVPRLVCSEIHDDWSTCTPVAFEP